MPRHISALGASLINRLAFAVLAAALVGCTSQQKGLTLTSLRRHQSFTPTFTSAYASRSASGALDVVLVDRGDGPVQQVMHVRMMWQPAREASETGNASIRWNVVSRQDPLQVLQYSGTASVTAESSSDKLVWLTIHSASLEPGAPGKGLVDPVGPSTLKGRIAARVDDRIVTALLSKLDISVAGVSVPHQPIPQDAAFRQSADAIEP